MRRAVPQLPVPGGNSRGKHGELHAGIHQRATEIPGGTPISASEFLKMMRDKRELLGMDSQLVIRSVNEGFSGGEKKKNEIFQMAMLNPLLSILDETDSGLDIDALRVVAEGVNRLQTKENATIVITHYQRLLEYIKPHKVHVLFNGKIVKSGDPGLALELERRGYDWIVNP